MLILVLLLFSTSILIMSLRLGWEILLGSDLSWSWFLVPVLRISYSECISISFIWNVARLYQNIAPFQRSCFLFRRWMDTNCLTRLCQNYLFQKVCIGLVSSILLQGFAPSDWRLYEPNGTLCTSWWLNVPERVSLPLKTILEARCRRVT